MSFYIQSLIDDTSKLVQELTKLVRAYRITHYGDKS